MLRRLGRKLTNNFGLKILAALSAIILWIVVVNIDDPLKTLPYTTSVTFENTDFISEQGRYYEVLDGNNTVTFRVSAQRSIQERLSNSDFIATADMEKIEYDDKSEGYRVPVTITAPKYTSKEVTIVGTQLYKEVTLEDLGRTQKQITARTKGTVADGCALGDLEINASNILKISGPSSIVSRIDTVVATINVDGMSTDVTDNVVPVLLDADGNAIDTTKLTLSINTVSITAEILNTKDVSLEFQTMGTVAEGYMETGIDYKPATVRIKGVAATLNPINKITIPEEVLDLSGATASIETVVDISAYLPGGTSLVLNSDAKVNVTVNIEQIVSKTFNVPVQNFVVENLRDGYEVSYAENMVTVEVTGPQNAMEGLTEKDIKGTADASGLGRGEHLLSISLSMEEDWYDLALPASIPVTISGNSTGQPTGSGTGDASSGGASSDGSTGGNAPTENGTSGNNTPSENGTSGDTSTDHTSAESGASGSNAPAEDAGTAGGTET